MQYISTKVKGWAVYLGLNGNEYLPFSEAALRFKGERS
jgi:hypothetical protein